MKRYFYTFLALYIFSSCSSIITEYDSNKIPVPEHFKNEILKKYDAEKVNYSLIYFTNNFTNDSIIISNENEQVFDNITTVESIGLAKIIRINNNLQTKIFNKQDKYYFKIPSNKYKFIYISKISNSRKKYKIVYSNILQGFM